MSPHNEREKLIYEIKKELLHEGGLLDETQSVIRETPGKVTEQTFVTPVRLQAPPQK